MISVKHYRGKTRNVGVIAAEAKRADLSSVFRMEQRWFDPRLGHLTLTLTLVQQMLLGNYYLIIH